MNKIYFWVFIGFSLAGAFILSLVVIYNLSDTFNENPCRASAVNMVEKLRKDHELWTWGGYSKDFCLKCSAFDPSRVNCKIYNLMMGFSEPKLDISQDSTALFMSSTFWNDTLNTDVDTLYIDLRNGSCNVKYIITKNDLGKVPVKDHLFAKFSSVPDYEVISESHGTAHYGYYVANTFNLQVLIQQDVANMDSVSRSIKSKYAQLFEKNNIDEFGLEIRIKYPLCKLCTDKRYKNHFELTNKRSDAYREKYKNSKYDMAMF